ncbi:hypothetical protein D3C73_786370 [compost metagenome]
MAVGFVVEQTVRQPDDFIHSQIRDEHRFDFCTVQVRVAIAIEQAFFGGDQRAFAVDVDRAAFEHEALGAIARTALDFEDLATDLRITVPRRIQTTVETAPGVEVPVHATDFTVVIDDKRRPGIADPGVVAGHLDNADIRHVQAGTGVFVLAGGNRHGHRFETGDGLGHCHVSGLCRFATQAPVVRALGPDHPGLGLRCPLGRHVKAVCARGAVQSGHGSQDSRDPSRVLRAPYRFGRRSRKEPQALRVCSSLSRSKLWTNTPSSVSLSSCTFSPNWLAINDEP